MHTEGEKLHFDFAAVEVKQIDTPVMKVTSVFVLLFSFGLDGSFCKFATTTVSPTTIPYAYYPSPSYNGSAPSAVPCFIPVPVPWPVPLPWPEPRPHEPAGYWPSHPAQPAPEPSPQPMPEMPAPCYRPFPDYGPGPWSQPSPQHYPVPDQQASEPSAQESMWYWSTHPAHPSPDPGPPHHPSQEYWPNSYPQPCSPCSQSSHQAWPAPPAQPSYQPYQPHPQHDPYPNQPWSDPWSQSPCNQGWPNGWARVPSLQPWNPASYSQSPKPWPFSMLQQPPYQPRSYPGQESPRHRARIPGPFQWQWSMLRPALPNDVMTKFEPVPDPRLQAYRDSYRFDEQRSMFYPWSHVRTSAAPWNQYMPTMYKPYTGMDMRGAGSNYRSVYYRPTNFWQGPWY